MNSNLDWMQIIGIFLFVLVAIPFWICYLPFYLVFKTVVTIWQPYFYRKQCKEWNRRYQEYLKKGIHIDSSPEVGRLFGIEPWGYKKND